MKDVEARLQALMRQALGGHRAPQKMLLEEIAALIRPYVARLLGGFSAQTEDVVQEILIAVYVKRETYVASQPILPWIYAIARYKVADHLRRERTRSTQSIETLPEEAFAVASAEPLAERDVNKLLSTLPEKQRRIITLVKLEGLTVAEAAARTGYSVEDIKVSVHRGLKALRRLLWGGSP